MQTCNDCCAISMKRRAPACLQLAPEEICLSAEDTFEISVASCESGSEPDVEEAACGDFSGLEGGRALSMA